MTVYATPGQYLKTTYLMINDTNPSATMTGSFSSLAVPGLPSEYGYYQTYVSDPQVLLTVYPTNAFLAAATTTNERATANVLDSSIAGATGTLGTALQAIYNEPAAQQSVTLNQLTGQNHANAAGILGGAVSDAWRPVYGRMGLDSSPQHIDSPTDPHAWITATGGVGHFGSNATVSGASMSDAGVMMGLDRNSGPETLGVVGGYMNAGSETEASGANNYNANLWELGLYGDYRRGPARAGFLVGYTGGHAQATNTVNIGTAAYQASGGSGVSLVTVAARGAWRLPVGSFKLTPIAGLTYTHVATSGFTQSGAGDFSLNVARSTENSARLRLLVRVSRRVSWLGVNWRPTAGVGVRQELLNPNSAVQEGFVGIPNSSFVVYGVHPNRTMGVMGVGVRATVAKHLSAQLSYRGEFGRSTELNTFEGNVSYRW
jgi:outer membrane autotransporter protein